MTTREFELFDAINRDGLDNAQWLILNPHTDTDTTTEFGTVAPYPLEEGLPYLAIWLRRSDDSSFIYSVVQRHHCDVYEEQEDGTDFYLFALD